MTLDRKLSRPGAEIAYADTGGDGLAVVLTHGAGVDHSTFESRVRVLQQQGYRVILWDLRGHGQSALVPGTRFTASAAAADFEALMTTCDVTDPVLVGHSLAAIWHKILLARIRNASAA